MKILMLIDKLGIGGTETHVLTLCETLFRLGIDTIIVSLEESINSRYKKSKFEIKSINQYTGLSNVDKLKTIVESEKIDIIHCHSIESMLLSKELYKLKAISYILTFHGLYYCESLIKDICKYAKLVIAVSNPVKEFLENNINREDISKIHTIYNGVKIIKQYPNHNNNLLKSKLGIPIDSKVILYCSRLSFSKGRIAEILINQVRSILKDNVYLIIIGDGVKKKSVDFYANSINKELNEKKIITLGNIDNVNSYYLISDIVVGTGRVAIEGLNFRKPVICYGIKSYVGIFDEKEHENIINTYFGDHDCSSEISKLTLVDSIEYLLNREDEYRKISIWGSNYCIENFDIYKLSKKYIEVIINSRDIYM